MKYFPGIFSFAFCQVCWSGRYFTHGGILCSIHFGKPMLECISSYFGGIIPGIIACYSQPTPGGIAVHLGLAWMMELAANLATHCMVRGGIKIVIFIT
ncbi:hypothetical protein [Flavihumibacter profundi]|uniref:hypothetical protein n=1 Tax=Flavihumibacter profundi TaxID=2716883 RepID=UPI001CC55ACC|nr:hypothetical protein [Flavihumibacter profundi]MBZ5855981.1 hypothetical protein [Flavihumibacter profundi]